MDRKGFKSAIPDKEDDGIKSWAIPGSGIVQAISHPIETAKDLGADFPSFKEAAKKKWNETFPLDRSTKGN